jgi:hypothetical protein
MFKDNITDIIKMSSFQSPFQYPGGKSRSRVIIYDISSEHFDLLELSHITPYFGGG